ncbi:hypothetical protein R6Q59_033174 [Mikania micrantha]
MLWIRLTRYSMYAYRILVGCSFRGPIPDSIGSLKQLVFLGLNNDSFIGPIPPSIGNLTKLSWLDLSDNPLSGPIPISNDTAYGLDNLVNYLKFELISLRKTPGLEFLDEGGASEYNKPQNS